jgi:glutaminase
MSSPVRATFTSPETSAPRFTIMSVANPLVFALVLEQAGLTAVRRLVGVNPTGMAFNSAQR